ncbi:MAG: hypothetical protein IPM13_18725 [Phycisphaerales bacterium]|nr:hypothetical protein [Phycisphaerales bacterium]
MRRGFDRTDLLGERAFDLRVVHGSIVAAQLASPLVDDLDQVLDGRHEVLEVRGNFEDDGRGRRSCGFAFLWIPDSHPSSDRERRVFVQVTCLQHVAVDDPPRHCRLPATRRAAQGEIQTLRGGGLRTEVPQRISLS